MRIGAFLVGLAVLLFRPTPAEAQARCGPSQEAGWVARVDLIPTRREAPLPAIIRGRLNIAVVEGEPLCANDLVRNPAGSAKRVRLRVTGVGPLEVRAGTEYLVPEPDWLSGLGNLVQPFNNYLRRSSRRGTVATSNATRGGSAQGCLLWPERQDIMAQVVADWSPIYLSWRCRRNRGGPWNVLVTSGPDSQNVVTYRNVVRLDPRRCRNFCIVVVTHVGSNDEVSTIHIQVVPPASAPLPPELRNVPMDSARRAMAGAWIMNQQDSGDWQLQGMSLLWDSGCDVPAAGQMAVQFYGALSPEEICDGRQ